MRTRISGFIPAYRSTRQVRYRSAATQQEPSMSDPFARIDPGTLRPRLDATVASALASGALQPIATREAVVMDWGVAFRVRQVDSLARKESERRRAAQPDAKRPRPANPFLPPEPDLTVGALSDTHLAVLNKFNVLASHLLVVTRRFEHQETLLTPADMEALARCLNEMDGLAFYNGGPLAGASQPHKHLQLVPLPLADGGPALPMEPRLLGEDGGDPPFQHALVRLDQARTSPDIDPAALHQRYLDLLGRIGVRPVGRDGGTWQSGPYNLLVTRRWMLAVPRRSECVDGISVNALGFAGSLFVRDSAGLAAIRRRGPMAVLCETAGLAAQ